MEALLDLYAVAPDVNRPLVCMDEFTKQLLSEVAPPIPVAPGKARKEDGEYVREGSASAFMIAAPHLGIREVFISENGRRTALDYADAIAFLCDEMFPEAEEIQLVQDNLNIHDIASLYKRFPPEKANRLARKIRIYNTPKHGSWLNIAEIEISVLSRQALSNRISSLQDFRRQIQANLRLRNAKPTPVKWHFTSSNARTKLKHLYPPV